MIRRSFDGVVMTIFLILNGLAVAFLFYVLVNFRNEARRSRNSGRLYRTDFERNGRPEVFVITHPISTTAQGGVSVIPFRARESALAARHAQEPGTQSVLEMPAKRASTR